MTKQFLFTVLACIFCTSIFASDKSDTKIIKRLEASVKKIEKKVDQNKAPSELFLSYTRDEVDQLRVQIDDFIVRNKSELEQIKSVIETARKANKLDDKQLIDLEQSKDSTVNKTLADLKNQAAKKIENIIKLTLFKVRLTKAFDKLHEHFNRLNFGSVWRGTQPFYTYQAWKSLYDEFKKPFFLKPKVMIEPGTQVSKEGLAMSVFMLLVYSILSLLLIKIICKKAAKASVPDYNNLFIVSFFFIGLFPFYILNDLVHKYIFYYKLASYSEVLLVENVISSIWFIVLITSITYPFKYYAIRKYKQRINLRVIGLLTILWAVFLYLNNADIFDFTAINRRLFSHQISALLSSIILIASLTVMIPYKKRLVKDIVDIDTSRNRFFFGKKLILFSSACIWVTFLLLALFIIGYSKLSVTLFVKFTQTFLLMWAGINVQYFIKKIMFKNYRKMSQYFEKTAMYGYWLMSGVNLLISFIGVVIFLLIWGLTKVQLLYWFNILFVEGFEIGDTSFSIFIFLRAIVVYLVIYYFFKWFALALEKNLLRYTKFDKGTKHAIITFTGYVGLALAIVSSIYSLGISSTTIAFILSAFTFGISFGLKEVISNIVCGLILLIERPIKVGDLIELEDDFALVKKIQLRATLVENSYQEVLVVPNSKLITSIVRNVSYKPDTRIDLVIETNYEDVEKASVLLYQVLDENPYILKSPKPEVVLSNFKNYGAEFNLSAYCAGKNRSIAQNDLRRQILKIFEENDIHIPYEKQIVYLLRPDKS